jgi:hypothetical protein
MTQQSFNNCPQCGANCLATATKCWLCHGSLFADREIEIVNAELVHRPPSALSEWFFGVSTVVILLVVLLVGIGIATDSPGTSMLYGIAVAPALIATIVRTMRKKERGEQVTWATRFVTLILSLAVTGVVVYGLIIAAIIATIVACFANPRGFH